MSVRPDAAVALAKRRLTDLSTRGGGGLPRREAPAIRVGELPGRNDRERMRVLERLLRAWAQIGADPINGCTLKNLAVTANYSYTHLQRTFKRVFGVSPHRAALTQRMQIARDLLLDTGLTVADVAGYAGYEDRASFGRAFRKHFGRSPTQLRALGRDEALAVP